MAPGHVEAVVPRALGAAALGSAAPVRDPARGELRHLAPAITAVQLVLMCLINRL